LLVKREEPDDADQNSACGTLLLLA